MYQNSMNTLEGIKASHVVDESPFNLWFRCQGVTSKNQTGTNKTETNAQIKLPLLVNNNDRQKRPSRFSNGTSSSNSSQCGSAGPSKPKIMVKSFGSSKHNSNSMITNLPTGSKHTPSQQQQQHEPCRTPQPHIFYQKCIDDVFESNKPKDMDKLVIPRELKYVHSIPYMKYVTFGSGKCFDTVWHIEMYKDD